MNSAELRSSFQVFLLGKNPAHNEHIQKALVKVGYNCSAYNEAAIVLSDCLDDPPHVLMYFVSAVEDYEGENFVERMRRVFPEVHLIAVGGDNQTEVRVDHYKKGIFDFVEYPPKHLVDVIKCVDRALCVEAQKYYSELKVHDSEQTALQLKKELTQKLEELKLLKLHNPVHKLPLLDVWMNQMSGIQDQRTAIDHFMKEVVRGQEGVDVIFLRYWPTKGSLVVSQAVSERSDELMRVGFELRTEDQVVTVDDMRSLEPENPLYSSLQGLLGHDAFVSLPMVVEGEFTGLFVIFNDHMSNQNSKSFELSPYLQVCHRVLRQRLTQLKLQKELFDLNRIDGVTGVLNKRYFFDALEQECVRARRIHLPVSLVLLSIDRFSEFANGQTLTDEETAILLKNLVKIIQRYGRANDIVGRIAMSDFAILLPHTDHNGASVKAERLRRIVEAADFAKVIPRSVKVTLSLGVSEYPTLSHDAHSLFETADRALQSVQRRGFNKVCVSAAKDNFTPDFIFSSQYDSTL